MPNFGFFGPPKTSPCKDCNNRKIGCHSVCDDYKAFYEKNENDRIKRFNSYVPGEYKYDNAK